MIYTIFYVPNEWREEGVFESFKFIFDDEKMIASSAEKVFVTHIDFNSEEIEYSNGRYGLTIITHKNTLINYIKIKNLEKEIIIKKSLYNGVVDNNMWYDLYINTYDIILFDEHFYIKKTDHII